MTTDTIYRGNILPNYQGQELNLVAVFHNSLTLLSAEIEGRSFGGGVLELVPSEISRLLIPFPIQQEKATEHLSCIVRKNIATSEKSDQLVEATDELISQHIEGFTSDLMDQLQAARQTLLERRLSRNS